MNRLEEEKTYWNTAATDPEVDRKYICDLDTPECLAAIGPLSGKVLELGCGVGRLMQDGYHGVDISEGMLAIAKQRKPACHYKLTDGRTIPHEANTFDAVYSMLVFQHLPSEGVAAYIKEAYRVLKPRGMFRFQFVEGAEAAPMSHKYSLQFMVLALQDSGFTVPGYARGLVHPEWTWITSIKENS